MASHELQRLQARHLKIAELVLQGMDHKEIAQLTGMSEVGIGGIVRSPLFQDYIAKRRKRREQVLDTGFVSGISAAKERLDELALEKVERLNDVAEGQLVIENDNQYKAISKLLDLAFNGDKAATAGGANGQGGVQAIQINAERIEFFMQVMNEDKSLRAEVAATA